MRKFLEVCGIIALLSCVSFAQTVSVGDITNGSGTTFVTADTSNLSSDPRYPSVFVYELQGDLTQNTTITYYGHVDSYALISIGANSSFATNFGSGSLSLVNGISACDNFSIGATSPSVFTITVGGGATVHYIIKGYFYR